MIREELKEHCEKQIKMCGEDAVNRQAVLNTLDNNNKKIF